LCDQFFSNCYNIVKFCTIKRATELLKLKFLKFLLHDRVGVFLESFNWIYWLGIAMWIWVRFCTSRTPPPFFNQIFSSTQHLQLCFNWIFFNFKIKRWQLSIKSTCLVYWYIVKIIFQWDGHLPNIPGINNVSKLNTQLCR